MIRKPSKYDEYDLVLSDHNCDGYFMPVLKNGRTLHLSCSKCSMAITNTRERKDRKVWAYTKK